MRSVRRSILSYASIEKPMNLDPEPDFLNFDAEKCLPIHFLDKKKFSRLDRTSRKDMNVVDKIRMIAPIHDEPYNSEPAIVHDVCALLAENTTTDAAFLKDVRVVSKRLFQRFEHEDRDFLAKKENKERAPKALADKKKKQFAWVKNYDDMPHLNRANRQFLGNNMCTAPTLHKVNIFTVALPLWMLLWQIIVSLFPFVLMSFWPTDYSTYLSTFSAKCSTHVCYPLYRFCDMFGNLGKSWTQNLMGGIYLISFGYNISVMASYVYSLSSSNKEYRDVITCLTNFRNDLERQIEAIDGLLDACESIESHRRFFDHTSSLRTELAQERDYFHQLVVGSTHFGTSWSTWGEVSFAHHRFLFDAELNQKVLCARYLAVYSSILVNSVDAMTDACFRSVCTDFCGMDETATDTVCKGISCPSLIDGVGIDVPLVSMILSGPNRTGKTTLIRTLTANAILTQIFGCGFYQEWAVDENNLFDSFNSYMNISDNPGKESKFEAETNRCKEIMEHINKWPNMKHLCIFDEIFSGTNPADAAKASVRFFEKLASSHPRSTFITTSHLVDFCKHFEMNPDLAVKNYHITYDAETKTSTYCLAAGFSEVSNADEFI